MRERFDLRAALPRLPGLLVGLILFGVGIGLMVEAGLGLGPWEALHQGIGDQLGLQIGTVSILLGIPILALWLPLGERPGLGTVLNVIFIGTATDVAIAVIPTAETIPTQLVMLFGGVVVIGLGSATYLSADLGPGPRDGLMTGLHHRFGWSIRRARTVIELSVLVVGWALGGTIGLGTVVFALGIGPLIQFFLGIVDREDRVGLRRRTRMEVEGVLGE